ncbi:MAG: putative hydrolase YxeP [Phycisphaerae bacterium]|nr:putative hydrolase YxeP [Phycisphaerae bacterium]
MSDALTQRIDAMYGDLVAIRHELHAHPELSYEEHETARRIRGWLGAIDGLDVRTGLAGGTGTVATLTGGLPGPTIALRADIDALPIAEQTGLPYASTRAGVMHACGHDGHMTCLLGTARLLAAMRPAIRGQVRFLFQPAEEGGAGAARMIEDGALDGVDAIFGLHGWPGRPVGHVATRPGALMASTDGFYITIHGSGSHGAYPHIGRDPILAASQVVLALQTIVSRRKDPRNPGVVTVGQFHGGTADNIVPETCKLSGTIRALDPYTRELLREQVEQIVRASAEAMGCRAEIRVGRGYPVTVNDPRMTELVAATARELVGAENFHDDEPPSMGGEDFAYYLERVPGCFFFIGACPAGADRWPALHTPQYNFADDALRVGMRMFCGLVERYPSVG